MKYNPGWVWVIDPWVFKKLIRGWNIAEGFKILRQDFTTLDSYYGGSCFRHKANCRNLVFVLQLCNLLGIVCFQIFDLLLQWACWKILPLRKHRDSSPDNLKKKSDFFFTLWENGPTSNFIWTVNGKQFSTEFIVSTAGFRSYSTGQNVNLGSFGPILSHVQIHFG